MAQFLPITLSGDNLGERHRYLNSQVEQAATDQPSFQHIADLPEQAPVDRLFKIDLAIKLKNVDYILENLKDDDMLYVSRALKCKWLLERRDIINPKYLEDVLFPEMVMPAISKIKHWLYINLRDPLMCQEFYQYYKDTKYDFAVKFLSHCDVQFVVNDLPKILTKITPHYLKVLGEKSPKFVKMYHDAMATDNELVKRYLKEEQSFYNSIKCVLKSDPDLFLDITEKYHSLATSNKLSPSATDYILRFHKNRFMAKPELYVVYLLHVPTVARRLSVEECQQVVIRLASADYLKWWFSYANVEPLVKRVSRIDRAAFKKRVFVEKNVGERVAEWPYELPASPAADDTSFEDPHVFHDQEYEPIQMVMPFWAMLKKRKYMAYGRYDMVESKGKSKSELQKLFNEFRFVGFEGTLHELKRRVGAASSADWRRDILLVLVSKSGGRADSVLSLLQLALRLRNEPVHERAAIVRSLAKRASAWRLPQDVWDTMLEYAHGLGLDGTEPEAECREGLHIVVLRQLFTTGDCEPAIRTAFLDNFSTFAEYKLVASEREAIATGLQRILVAAAIDAEPEAAASYLGQLLDVLEKFRIHFASSPAVSAVAALAERDTQAARPLLIRLYEARVGRRELLRKYLEFRHDDAALVNALRHDPHAITPEWLVKLLTDGETRANQFLLKIAVYFNEAGGRAEHIRQALQDKVAQEPNVKLARPLATLAGYDISSIWFQQDVAGAEHFKLAAALRANMHRARPAPDALALGWRKAGMKAVVWRAMRCRPAHVTRLVQALLEERVKRTVRLALVLAQRTDCAADIFSIAVTIRPLAALRAALLYYRSLGAGADLRIWDIVKSYISSADLTPRESLRHILRKVEWMPNALRPDYCAILHLALDRISDRKADYVLRDLMKCLPDVSDNLLEKVLSRVLQNIDKENPESYPAIVFRYLMLSKTDNDLKTRLETVGEPFIVKIDSFRGGDRSKRHFFQGNFDQIMTSLQYNAAFFDIKYQCCLPVIERVLAWMRQFMAKEIYFQQYVKIHATMLYHKAVRQSLKQKPEVFEDPVKKLSEGVEIVGFTFGRYIVKELDDLISKYFDSVIELYRTAFVDYLGEYFMYSISKQKFMAAIIKGIISESVGGAGRLAVHILEDCLHNLEGPVSDGIKELLMKTMYKETQLFGYAQIFSSI